MDIRDGITRAQWMGFLYSLLRHYPTQIQLGVDCGKAGVVYLVSDAQELVMAWKDSDGAAREFIDAHKLAEVEVIPVGELMPRLDPFLREFL